MKKFAAYLWLLVVALPAVAVEGDQVRYVGGTVPAITSDTIGSLDTTSEMSLTFNYKNTSLVIPYGAIDSFEYSKEVTHHLGVLPAIAVGLLKKRERRHFFRISYHDADHTVQIAVFEVPKQMPRTLEAVLAAHVPNDCTPLRPICKK